MDRRWPCRNLQRGAAISTIKKSETRYKPNVAHSPRRPFRPLPVRAARFRRLQPPASRGLSLGLTPRKLTLVAHRVAPPPRRSQPISHLQMPVRPAVSGNVQGQFKPRPDAQLVKSGAQIVLHHLLAGYKDPGNVLVGEPLPDQSSYLNFLGG